MRTMKACRFMCGVCALGMMAAITANTSSNAQLTAEYTERMAELETVERNIAAENSRLSEINARAATLRARKTELEADYQRLEVEAAKHTALLTDELRALYALEQTPPLARILDEANTRTRHSAYIAQLSRAHVNTLRTIELIQSSQTRNLEDYQANLTALNAARAEILTAQQTLQADMQAQQARVAEISALLARDAELAEASRQSAQQAYDASITSTVPNMAATTADIQNFNFAAHKGELNWPSAGQFRPVRDQFFHHAWRVTHAAPQAVRAVAPGKVVLRQYIPRIGHMLMLAHAGNYYSIYAHLNQMNVAVNDQVPANTIIAYSGNSGGQPNMGMFFQLRHNKAPLPLSTWMQ